MSCPIWQWHRTGSRWPPVRTLPVAPLWCDLGFFPNSRGYKSSANLRPIWLRHPQRGTQGSAVLSPHSRSRPRAGWSAERLPAPIAALRQMSQDVFTPTFGDNHKFHHRNLSRSKRAPEFVYPDTSSNVKIQELDQNFPVITKHGLSSVGIIVEQDSVSLRMIVVDLTTQGKEMASRVWKGDIVVQVDGQGTSNMSLNQLNVLLAGPTGTCAEIILLRPIPADDTYSRAQVNWFQQPQDSIQMF